MFYLLQILEKSTRHAWSSTIEETKYIRAFAFPSLDKWSVILKIKKKRKYEFLPTLATFSRRSEFVISLEIELLLYIVLSIECVCTCMCKKHNNWMCLIWFWLIQMQIFMDYVLFSSHLMNFYRITNLSVSWQN